MLFYIFLLNIDKAFYDILWKASHKEKLTQENIHDNVITMLVAVYKTFLYVRLHSHINANKIFIYF